MSGTVRSKQLAKCAAIEVDPMKSGVAISHRKGHAVALLAKIIDAGWFDVQRVASVLVSDEREVGLYLAGLAPMPLERQLCLALFLIDSVPPLSRQGHNLLSRVRAEMAYVKSDNVLHRNAPVPNSRSY